MAKSDLGGPPQWVVELQQLLLEQGADALHMAELTYLGMSLVPDPAGGVPGLCFMVRGQLDKDWQAFIMPLSQLLGLLSNSMASMRLVVAELPKPAGGLGVAKQTGQPAVARGPKRVPS